MGPVKPCFIVFKAWACSCPLVGGSWPGGAWTRRARPVEVPPVGAKPGGDGSVLYFDFNRIKVGYAWHSWVGVYSWLWNTFGSLKSIRIAVANQMSSMMYH